MTTANEIKFGIELETLMPNSESHIRGRYHRGLQVEWLPTGWKAEADSSIRTRNGSLTGCEFVSPVMQGAEGLKTVVESVEKISQRGGQVNASCGIHITFTWNGDSKALARLLHLFANHEKAIYASTGTHSREGGSWCKGMKQYGDCSNAQNRMNRDRYHVVNLTHLARGANRIEIRAFAGSLNATKIAGHVAMVLGLVELALNATRRQSWNYTQKEGTKGPWAADNRGNGETELRRLFYRLGWTKGHAKKQFGGEVLSEATATMKEIKKELTRLAKKYDGRVC